MKNIIVLLLISLSTSSFTQNEFAFNLFKEMNEDNNTFFSPTSIKVAFAMAYEGANSDTQIEFENTFGFSEKNERFHKEITALKEVAKISNSIWIQQNYTILSSYVSRIKKQFDSEPYLADFKNGPDESANRINEWISNSTNGMIKKMVSPSSVKEFKMALINAIYFKENWAIQFKEQLTKERDFTNLDGSIKKVQMMRSSDSYKAYAGKNEKVVELMYEDKKTSMIIILPEEMKGYKVSNKSYANFNEELVRQKVNLMLPKFTFETGTIELKPMLKKMGFSKAFSDAADFSGMRTEKDLKIGKVLHKAKIIVNEKGTEAAGATVVGMVKTTSVSTPRPQLDIIVNKPFFYFIKDNRTNSILFMGRMTTMN